MALSVGFNNTVRCVSVNFIAPSTSSADAIKGIFHRRVNYRHTHTCARGHNELSLNIHVRSYAFIISTTVFINLPTDSTVARLAIRSFRVQNQCKIARCAERVSRYSIFAIVLNDKHL